MTDSKSIVGRLRKVFLASGCTSLCNEAAAIIESQDKQIAELEHDLRICKQNTQYKDKDYLEVCGMVAELQAVVDRLAERVFLIPEGTDNVAVAELEARIELAAKHATPK